MISRLACVHMYMCACVWMCVRVDVWCNNCELCVHVCMCLCEVMEVVVTNETRYCGFNTFFMAARVLEYKQDGMSACVRVCVCGKWTCAGVEASAPQTVCHLPHHSKATTITCSQVTHMCRHNSLSIRLSVCLSLSVHSCMCLWCLCVWLLSFCLALRLTALLFGFAGTSASKCVRLSVETLTHSLHPQYAVTNVAAFAVFSVTISLAFLICIAF